MALDYAETIPSLVGSLLSAISTSIVLFTILLNWHRRNSLRHVLLLNLFVSECFNSINNTVSGFYIVVSKRDAVPVGHACNANGFIGQLTVQGTDFSVLAMAISTLTIVLRPTIGDDSSKTTRIAATVGIWLFPLVTSTTVAGLHAYGPVTGNWCWISSGHDNLRYGLAHGPRMAIIVLTVLLYAFIYRIIKSKTMNSSTASDGYSYGQTGAGDKIGVEMETTQLVCHANSVHDKVGTDHQVAITVVPSEARQKADRKEKRQDIARMMLMKAYPFSYVILWIPGMANRLASLAGHNVRALVILQASTQFIGFVDSVLYLIQWRVFKTSTH